MRRFFLQKQCVPLKEVYLLRSGIGLFEKGASGTIGISGRGVCGGGKVTHRAYKYVLWAARNPHLVWDEDMREERG